MSSEKQGSSKGGLQCRVKLLDGSDFHLDLEKKEIGRFVFDQILRRIGLADKDKEYFGIEYEDDQKMPQWLDLQKPVKKQIKKSPCTLMFKVKYYPLDPVPHPGCRTHFYRQFRRDLIASKMRCPTHNVPDVLACILQADMGDFESIDQDIEFMTDESLIIDPSLENAAIQDEVVKLHRLHKGTTPQDAVKAFLRKVRELETYGVKLFDVKHDDSACQLGLSPHGVSLFRRNRRIFVHDWLVVSQISFKTKRFILLIEKDIGGEMQLIFELDSMKSSKELWSICRQYAEFYTEPRRRIQEEPDPQTQNLRSPGAQGTTSANGGDHFTFPPAPQTSDSNQHKDPFVDNSQKVKSLPRYLPTSNDSIAAALRLNRHKKADSASPEHSTSTSPPAADGVLQARSEEADRIGQSNASRQSHDQLSDSDTHYDSLDCRNEYLAQVQAQQISQVQAQQAAQIQAQQAAQMQAQQAAQMQAQQAAQLRAQQAAQMQAQQAAQMQAQQAAQLRAQQAAQLRAQQAAQLQAQQAAQMQAQQMHEENVNMHTSAPSTGVMPDARGVSASRSHSTINPEDLSQEQDMDGSLLDLADALGGEEEEEEEEQRKESPRTGQTRWQGNAAMTTTQAPNGYHSHTLPHSFSSAGRSPRQRTDGSPRHWPDRSPRHWADRSPRLQTDGSPRQRADSSPWQRSYGSADDGVGPPKPPRTDHPHLTHTSGHDNAGAVMTGNSPYLPGSSFTTGRQHQKKKNLVRTWVQEQQLRTYQSSSSQESSTQGSPAHLRRGRLKSSPDIRGDPSQNGRLSAHSSAGSVGKSPGASPLHPRSHDLGQHLLSGSPFQEGAHAVQHTQSHDQNKQQPIPVAPPHVPQKSPSADVQQVQPVKPVSQPHSHSPPQPRGGGTDSVPKTGFQYKTASDSPSPQQFRRKTSETLNHLQNDPQFPALIQQIDELMGGLLDDSPAPERKEQTLTSPETMTSSMLKQQPPPQQALGGVEERGRNGNFAKRGDEASILSPDLDIPFPKNINPADFIRDEDIKIDPRNFLNTPSPEPNLLDLKVATTKTGPETGSSSSFQHSPLIGGILSYKLQEAMDEEADYHDPPPPPPHLMALTQGFKDPSDRGGIPGSRVKKQPPSVSPKPRSTASGGGKDQKLEQKRRSGKDPAAAYDPSSLPPEIASFMTKVRNRSFDGADTTQQPLLAGRGHPSSGELPRTATNEPALAERPSSAIERGQRSPVEVPPTYDVPRLSVSPTFDPLKVEVSAQNDHQAPATVERVTITPDAQDSGDERRSASLSAPNQSGRPSSAETSPTVGSHSSPVAIYPEAYNPTGSAAVAGKEPAEGRGGKSSAQQQQQQQSSLSANKLYTYAYYKQSSQDKRDQLNQQFINQNQPLPQPSTTTHTAEMGWNGERVARREVAQQQPQVPPQQYQLRSQPNAASKSGAMSLPRGQALPYHGASPQHDSRGSSDGSASTTPHAQSDMALSSHAQPRSPTGAAPDSFGYRYQSYATGQQPQQPVIPPNPAHSGNNYPPPIPPHHQGGGASGSGYYPPGPQDIRRAQTFSMGQGVTRPSRSPHHHHHHHHPGGEDSLPNSPTYFAQNPPAQFHDRQMLSPGSMANNRSFQEHLETLNTTRHGRKMRVLDWMQKQQQVEPQHMIRDPSAELPTQPYQRQTHIYASAAELDPPISVPTPTEQNRPSSVQGMGMGMGIGTGMGSGGGGGGYYNGQERGRLNTFPYNQQHQGQYSAHTSQWSQQPGATRSSQVDRGARGYVNVPPHAHVAPRQLPVAMGVRGNVGRPVGAPAKAQTLPTAKFEKDYYILDV